MKSIEVKFNEALAAIDKAGKRKSFDEKVKGCTTIESKLHAAEAVLKDVGIVREAQPIRKHNGAADNFSETNPLRPVEDFREGANSFSPGYITETTDPFTKGDKVLFEALGLPMPGAKPEGYDKLTEAQRKDFDFARLIGINEADAFRVAKMSGSTFTEVSR